MPYWQSDDGHFTIYNANSSELTSAMSDSAVDAVITDPPYGEDSTHAKHMSTITLRDGSQARQSLGFEGVIESRSVEMAAEWVRVAKRWVVFTGEWRYAKAIEDAGLLVRMGIWRKPDGAPQFTGDRPGTGWEPVLICHRPGKKRWNGGGKHAFWEFPKGQNKTGHPTGKPLGLFEAFVRDFTDEGETVLDPYMGSGTTGLACAKLGRKFIGIELNKAYCDIAVARIKSELARPRIPGFELHASKSKIASLFG